MILVLTVAMTLLLGPPVSQAVSPPAYRITADRDANSFTLGVNEPLQVHVNQGQTRTFSFNQPVTEVISRNPTVATITVANGAIEAQGLIPGRTGMRIAFEGGSTLFMGLRVDHPDGSLPGLPGPVALGSVSEDCGSHVAFWQDHVPGPKGTRMDIRYIYLPGGPFTGWSTWYKRVEQFTANSLIWGMVPFFVFYNIPDEDESAEIDLRNVQDSRYMTAYYENLDKFLTQAKEVMQGELYGVVVEPDFLGYMQKDANPDPSKITTADGNLVGTVTKINQTIAQAIAGGQNILFGWQLNLWADAPSIPTNKGVIRLTDDDLQGWVKGRETIVQAATNTANYAVAAGVLSHGADFLVIDKYGVDGGCTNPPNPVDASSYFWNNDHWMNYLLFVNTLSQVSGKPVVLWQLPISHINGSTTISARTGNPFPALPNIKTKFEDSSATFFFGDAFDAVGNVFDSPSPTRISFFSQNQAGDSTLQVSGNRITWGSHIDILPEYGVLCALFGQGGSDYSTWGIPPRSDTEPYQPPADDYFWIQKVQKYYQEHLHRNSKSIAPIVQLLLVQ